MTLESVLDFEKPFKVARDVQRSTFLLSFCLSFPFQESLSTSPLGPPVNFFTVSLSFSLSMVLG